jgi:predicted nucleotidyltransferase
MKPSAALAMHRARLLARLDRAPVRNPRVFGSVAGGRDRDGSDLDLLVDVMPGATLFALGELQVDLEDMLGVHVDLLTERDLPETFRGEVLAQARPL